MNFIYKNMGIDGSKAEEMVIQSAYKNVVYPVIFTTTLTDESCFHPFAVGGSCILVKYNNTFFAITAKHVLKKIDIEQQWFVMMIDDGMNKIMFEWARNFTSDVIGYFINDGKEKIDESSTILPAYFTDLCVIQLKLSLVQGNKRYPKQNFLDLDNPLIFQRINSLPELCLNELVIAQGYPFKYKEQILDAITYNLKKIKSYLKGYIGEAKMEHQLAYISCERTENTRLLHEDFNGMSGGILLSLADCAEEISWLGVIMEADNNRINYCPAKVILDFLAAIKKNSINQS